jgi:hypothetical protein
MTYDENYTEFLPAKRASIDKIMGSYDYFNCEKFIGPIFDATPGYFLILNEYRQTVYANTRLSAVLHGNEVKSILGLRPGEIFNCVNALSSPGGCGTAKACRVCGAGTAILESMTKAVKAEKECRITTCENDMTRSLELMVTAAPLPINGDQYYILSLADISDEKRRMFLERVFLHDVVNIAGGLKTIINYLKFPEKLDTNLDLLHMADVSTTSLLEEIASHSSLVSAEIGELKVDYIETRSKDLLYDVVQILAWNDAAKAKSIYVTENSENVIFSTDKILLRRILVNLAKNALEACNKGETVTLSCHKSGNDVKFIVNNKGIIPEEIQMQIFQRSFSTKGSSRGIGTYSIKLFTERYLKGKVCFTSNEETGTTFTARYPIDPEV